MVQASSHRYSAFLLSVPPNMPGSGMMWAQYLILAFCLNATHHQQLGRRGLDNTVLLCRCMSGVALSRTSSCMRTSGASGPA